MFFLTEVKMEIQYMRVTIKYIWYFNVIKYVYVKIVWQSCTAGYTELMTYLVIYYSFPEYRPRLYFLSTGFLCK
jgi:hypothetical protein